MKYIITENRLNNIIFNYLDGIKWDIFDYTDWQYGEMTRLFFKGESQYPENAIFEAYQNEDCIGDEEEDEECPEERVLLVRTQFYQQIMSLFGLDQQETNLILIKWYERYTNETIDDKTLGFMD